MNIRSNVATPPLKIQKAPPSPFWRGSLRPPLLSTCAPTIPGTETGSPQRPKTNRPTRPTCLAAILDNLFDNIDSTTHARSNPSLFELLHLYFLILIVGRNPLFSFELIHFILSFRPSSSRRETPTLVLSSRCGTPRGSFDAHFSSTDRDSADQVAASLNSQTTNALVHALAQASGASTGANGNASPQKGSSGSPSHSSGQSSVLHQQNAHNNNNNRGAEQMCKPLQHNLVRNNLKDE